MTERIAADNRSKTERSTSKCFDSKKQDRQERQLPEKLRYTKYYEHDGQLRAYANRSMLMAGLFGVIAFVSLLFAIYVRLQPPTVIRIAADGEATVVGGRSVDWFGDRRPLKGPGGYAVARGGADRY